MTKAITITYRGIEFTVEGEWVPYIPAVMRADPGASYPAEGGYFQDYKITHAGSEMTELLLCSEELADLAAKAVMEGKA